MFTFYLLKNYINHIKNHNVIKVVEENYDDLSREDKNDGISKAKSSVNTMLPEFPKLLKFITTASSTGFVQKDCSIPM